MNILLNKDIRISLKAGGALKVRGPLSRGGSESPSESAFYALEVSGRPRPAALAALDPSPARCVYINNNII